MVSTERPARGEVRKRRTPGTAATAAASPAASVGRRDAQDGQDRAYQFIRERILDGQYAPGQSLRAQDIAEATTLSRTPVREALGRLVQDGLVIRNDGWGFMVRTPSFQDVLDLFNVRAALEVEAARAAVARLDAAAVRDLSARLDASAAAHARGDDVGSIRLARAFHVAITELSGNRLLLEMLKGINDRIHMVGIALIKGMPGRAAEVLEENRRILSALVRKDAAALEVAVRGHIERSRALFLERTLGGIAVAVY